MIEKIKKLLVSNIDILVLIFIIYLGIYVRLSTVNAKMILDYDPWWHYRHTEELLNNNLMPLKWDILSFYPPGRPANEQQGYYYILAIGYKVLNAVRSTTFMRYMIWAPAIFAGLAAIPAYMTGRLITNKWGGLVTALFVVLAPTFIGVSMAGYVDDDVSVVFWTFVTAFSFLYLMKKKAASSGWIGGKKTIFAYLLAIISFFMFAASWNQGWYLAYFFVAFAPVYWIFLSLIEIRKKAGSAISKIFKDKFVYVLKNLLLPLAIVAICASAIGLTLKFAVGLPFNDPITSFYYGVLFFQKSLLIVNISVAELQVINVFTQEGFLAVASRVGLLPFMLAIVGLPLIAFLKFWKKHEITLAEMFAFVWLIITFVMITQGVRFSLEFSCAVAAAAGFAVGNITKYLKEGSEFANASILKANKAAVVGTIYALLLLAIVLYVSDSNQLGLQGAGMEVDQNWVDALNWIKSNAGKDALITTWWDPGHIIAGYTGHKVLADGAHCPQISCIPYDHNIRIQDTGRMFSVSDENESLSIIKKYISLTPEQCKTVRDTFGNIVPQDACNPVTEVYVIASSDLIGKYHWMSYFGTGTATDFFQLSLTGYDQQQGILNYANGVVSLVSKGSQLVPVYNNKYIIKEMVFYPSGKETYQSFANATDTIDGLLWVDPSFRLSIFMQPQVRDSVFTKMFFWNGKGLNNFDLVFSNSEVKVFKVNL
jgi:dolichyl-diphosphooligosaccharide--protein glycosyltransferase